MYFENFAELLFWRVPVNSYSTGVSFELRIAWLSLCTTADGLYLDNFFFILKFD